MHPRIPRLVRYVPKHPRSAPSRLYPVRLFPDRRTGRVSAARKHVHEAPYQSYPTFLPATACLVSAAFLTLQLEPRRPCPLYRSPRGNRSTSLVPSPCSWLLRRRRCPDRRDPIVVTVCTRFPHRHLVAFHRTTPVPSAGRRVPGGGGGSSLSPFPTHHGEQRPLVCILGE